MPKDSLEKIFESYILPIVRVPTKYKNKVYEPLDKIIISHLIFKEIKCVKNCGACCLKYSMDFLPKEKKPDIELSKRVFENKEVYTFKENGKNERYCDLMDIKSGLCSIHDLKPFSCDFEMVRFKTYKKDKTVYIGNYPYGRAWNMLNINGERGALCIKSDDYTKECKADVIRKFERLKMYIDYFEVNTYIDLIIKHLKILNLGCGIIINNGVVINE